MAIAAVCAACGHEPLDDACPSLGVGDLVVTELRGPQVGDDGPWGQWIEVYAPGGAVDLAGLRVVLTQANGADAGELIVRQDARTNTDGYAALGRFPPDATPGFAAYGYQSDFDDDLYTTAAIDLISCGVRVDRLIYRSLTEFGTLALDGDLDPPSASGNDDETAFCVDDRIDDQDPSAGAGGTPGAPNPPCS